MSASLLWVFCQPGSHNARPSARARRSPLTSAASHELAATHPVLALQADARASHRFAHKDMECTLACDVLGAFIAQGAQIDVAQEMLPGTE